MTNPFAHDPAECVHSQIARSVVNFVGWTLILCVAGTLVVGWTGAETPAWFKDIAIFALGGLAGVLTRPQTNDTVTVDNSPANPVPTEPVE